MNNTVEKRKPYVSVCLLAMLFCLIFISAPVSAAAKKYDMQMCVGNTKILTIHTNKKVVWSSSRKDIADVRKNGKVTARKKGYVNIKAKSGNKTYVYKINVCGHSYKKATCQKAKVCKYCNRTTGKKLEHKWKTDSKAGKKICIRCRTTKAYSSKEQRPDTVSVYEKLKKLRKEYPEGKRWTDENHYKFKWDKMYCDYSGCAGFAEICSDYLFPGYKRKMHKNYNRIKEGDTVRLNGVHSVVVWKISGSRAILCEGNYGGKIHWGRTMRLSELRRRATYVITRVK